MPLRLPYRAPESISAQSCVFPPLASCASASPAASMAASTSQRAPVVQKSRLIRLPLPHPMARPQPWLIRMHPTMGIGAQGDYQST